MSKFESQVENMHSHCIILSVHDGCNVQSDCEAGGGRGSIYSFCHGGKGECVWSMVLASWGPCD